jgi:hypothetical protein
MPTTLWGFAFGSNCRKLNKNSHQTSKQTSGKKLDFDLQDILVTPFFKLAHFEKKEKSEGDSDSEKELKMSDLRASHQGSAERALIKEALSKTKVTEQNIFLVIGCSLKRFSL